TWAAAATSRIGLGTSVLVAPQHNPLWLPPRPPRPPPPAARPRAPPPPDALSVGRLTPALGVGWSEGEFDALGVSFQNRGARTDEIVGVLRACWRDDPSSFRRSYYRFRDLRVLPKPAHDLPIWIGGGSEPAYRRG